MPSQPFPAVWVRAALVAQALAHPMRLALLEAIGDQGAYVMDLVQALARPQPHISRQLAVLREAGLVTTERRGTYIHYRLAEGVPELLAALGGVAEALPPEVGSGPEAGPPRRWRGGRRYWGGG